MAYHMGSPSTRRAWIEIHFAHIETMNAKTSPSTRRAWIEIYNIECCAFFSVVALHPEGVDRNSVSPFANAIAFSRPPPGGRG